MVRIHMVSPLNIGIIHSVQCGKKNRKTISSVVAMGAVLGSLSQFQKTRPESFVLFTASTQFLTRDLMSSLSSPEKNCMRWREKVFHFQGLERSRLWHFSRATKLNVLGYWRTCNEITKCSKPRVLMVVLDSSSEFFKISNLSACVKNIKCLGSQPPSLKQVNLDGCTLRRSKGGRGQNQESRSHPKEWRPLSHHSTPVKPAHPCNPAFLREPRNLDFDVKSKFGMSWTNLMIQKILYRTNQMSQHVAFGS